MKDKKSSSINTRNARTRGEEMIEWKSVQKYTLFLHHAKGHSTLAATSKTNAMIKSTIRQLSDFIKTTFCPMLQ